MRLFGTFLMAWTLMFTQSASAEGVQDIQKFLQQLWARKTYQKKDIAAKEPRTIDHKDDIFFCGRDQMQIYDVERTLLKEWRKDWGNLDAKAFSRLWKAPADSRFIFAGPGKGREIASGILRKPWETERTESVKSHFARFKKLEFADLRLDDFVVDYNQRDNNYRFDRFEGTVEADLRGLAAQGHRVMEKASWRVLFERVAGAWKISQMRLLDGETLASSRAPAFVDGTSEKGLQNLPIYLRTEAIRRGGYALALSDINNDGRTDLLVGYRDGVGLFLQNAQGRFVNALKGSGLEKLNYVKTAIFADFRNKGVKDLVVTTLLPGPDDYEGTSSVLYFQGDNKGHFKKQDLGFAKKRGFLQPMPAAVGDFNNDGFLDLYVGYPGVRDFTTLYRGENIKNTQGMYINNGHGGFNDFTDQFDNQARNNSAVLFPHAGFAVNYDQTGGIDILVADDRNNLSPIYRNDSKMNFKQVASEIGLGNRGLAMSFAAGDYDNDGITDIIVTNVNFLAAQRTQHACRAMWSADTPYAENGVRLFKGLGGGRFREVTEEAGLTHFAGQGGAGVTFIDYDGDGLMDIYAVNGLWSGDPEGDDLAAPFIAYMTSPSRAQGMQHTLKPEGHSGFKGVLRTLQGDIDAHGKLVFKKGLFPSMLGFQRNQLFHNNGDGTFTDVAYLEGVDSMADGYIVGTMVNPEGKPDLILRNGDPGSSRTKFPVVQYFKNQFPGTNSYLQLTLEGTHSNRDAIGSFVVADFKDHKQVQHLVANSGSFQNENILLFSLGKAKEISSLEIHWPNGGIQTLEHVKAGRLHIREPDFHIQSAR